MAEKDSKPSKNLARSAWVAALISAVAAGYGAWEKGRSEQALQQAKMIYDREEKIRQDRIKFGEGICQTYADVSAKLTDAYAGIKRYDKDQLVYATKVTAYLQQASAYLGDDFEAKMREALNKLRAENHIDISVAGTSLVLDGIQGMTKLSQACKQDMLKSMNGNNS